MNPDHQIAENNVNIEIPAFLKSFFRPIAFVEYEKELICSTQLISEGFHKSKVRILIYFMLFDMKNLKKRRKILQF